MTTNPINEFAPYPPASTVTADSLARHETVSAIIHDQRAGVAMHRSKEEFRAACGHAVGAFSIAYLLRAFIAAAPAEADAAAGQLVSMCEDGALAEWLYDWAHGYGLDTDAVAKLGRDLAQKSGAA